jgi:hypothetical protein
LSHTDHQLGRVLDFLREAGESVTVDLSGDLISDSESEMRLAMARQ